MPADPAHQLALAQLGDAETAVPVSSAEQQTSVVGHHQHLSTDVHPGGERSAQETLCSAPQKCVCGRWGGVGEDQSESETRSESELQPKHRDL